MYQYTLFSASAADGADTEKSDKKKLIFAGPVVPAKANCTSKLALVTLAFGPMEVELSMSNEKLSQLSGEPAFVPAWLIPPPAKDAEPTLIQTSEDCVVSLPPEIVGMGKLERIADDSGKVIIPFRCWSLELAKEARCGPSGLVLTYRASRNSGKGKGKGGGGGKCKAAAKDKPGKDEKDRNIMDHLGHAGWIASNGRGGREGAPEGRPKGAGKASKVKQPDVPSGAAHLLR